MFELAVASIDWLKVVNVLIEILKMVSSELAG